VRRERAPSAVQDLASGDFLRNIRDGGPQARQSEGLPPVDPAWIGATAEDTARNVVGALCRHHYGDSVCVDEVLAGPDAARGREYTVTLALSDRHVFGSCHSTQVQDFDRDTTALLEELRRADGWDQRIYRLKVQTPGTDRELAIPDDLWKCELFPCCVHWEAGGKRHCRHLQRLSDGSGAWRLADASPNYQRDRQALTQRQRDLRFDIEDADLIKVSIQVDTKSQKRLQKVKQALQLGHGAELAEGLRHLAAEESEPDDEAAGVEDPEVEDGLEAGASGEEDEGHGAAEEPEGNDEEAEEETEEMEDVLETRSVA